MIRCGDLDSYPLLQHLDLSSNHIEFIEDDALGRLEILATVFLNNNSLTNVPTSLPSSLINLQLQHNQITDIQSSSFVQLTNLETLNLAGNRLTYLPGLPLPKLITLNLRAAGLRGLSQSVAQLSPNLRELLLESNPIKCTELLGIAEWASPCRSENLFEFIQPRKSVDPDTDNNRNQLTNKFLHESRCCGKTVDDRTAINKKKRTLPPICFNKEKLINSSYRLTAAAATAAAAAATNEKPTVVVEKTTTISSTTVQNANDLWQTAIDNDGNGKKFLPTNQIDYGNNRTTMSQSGQSATAVTDTSVFGGHKLGDNNAIGSNNNNNGVNGVANKSLGKYNGSVNLDDNVGVVGRTSPIVYSHNDNSDGVDADDDDGVVHGIVTHNGKTKGFNRQLKMNAKDKLSTVAIANTTSYVNDNDDANILIVDETMLSTTMKLRQENLPTISAAATTTTTTATVESGNKKRWKNIAKTSNKIRPTAIVQENKEVLPILQKHFPNNATGSVAIKTQPTVASNLHTTAINQTSTTKAVATLPASDNKNSLKREKITLHSVENKFNATTTAGGVDGIQRLATKPAMEWETVKNRQTTNGILSTKRQIVVHQKKSNKLKQQSNDKLAQRPPQLLPLMTTMSVMPVNAAVVVDDDDDKETYLGDEGKPLTIMPQKLATSHPNKKHDNGNDDDNVADDGNHNDKLDNLADSLAKMMTRQKGYNILTQTGLPYGKQQRVDNVTPQQQNKQLQLPLIYEKQQEQQQQHQHLKYNNNGNSKKEIINWNTNNPISQQLQDNETTNIKQVTASTTNGGNKVVQREHLVADQPYKYRQQQQQQQQENAQPPINSNQSNRNGVATGEHQQQQEHTRTQLQNNINELIQHTNILNTTSNNRSFHGQPTPPTKASESNRRGIEAALKLNNHYDTTSSHRKNLKTINQDNIEVFPVLAKSLAFNKYNNLHNQTLDNTQPTNSDNRKVAAAMQDDNNNNNNNNENAAKQTLKLNSHIYPEGNEGGVGGNNGNNLHNQHQHENGDSGKCNSGTVKCENNIYAIDAAENALNAEMTMTPSTVNHVIKENVGIVLPSKASPSDILIQRHNAVEAKNANVIPQRNGSDEYLNTSTSGGVNSSTTVSSSSTNGVPEQWNDIRDSTSHPGLLIVIGVTIGMIVSVALIHLYRCRRPWSPNQRSRKLHDDEQDQYTPAHRDLLPMDILDSSSANPTTGHCSTIHYTDTPIDLW